MTRTKLFFTTLATCTLMTLPLGAQETAREATSPVPNEPTVRVDFALPSVGVATTTAEGSATQLGVGIRVAHQSGHGARFDLAGWATNDLQLFNSAGYASAVSYDFSYFYRFQLAGNERFGMALDLGGGSSLQTIEFHQASTLFGPSPSRVEENVADGVHLGGVLIAALDGRADGFTFGIDVRAHTTFALQGASNDARVQADLSLNTSLGFGFY